AKEQGLRIYTIGVGADRMEVDSFFGSQTVNPSRDLDEDTLRHLAQATGGLYLRAKNTEALAKVYTELDRLEPASTDTELFRPRTELFIWPLGLALGFSVLMAGSLLMPKGGFVGIRGSAKGQVAESGVGQ
ncbi:MAG: BatB protein, partial [Nitrospirota bacterium]|nr:BatB protein [Nitrospirota bacterium]